MCNSACLQFAGSYFREDEVRGKKVIEIGSRNVNGSVRDILESFEPMSYVGVDVVNGPGVDEICDINRLTERFGTESFDVVVSTELVEHVRDWRSAVSNLKRILKPNGTLLLTTRSKGFRYHGYPYDFWRYEIEDVHAIFGDLTLQVVESDPISPGVFVKAHKEAAFLERNLKAHSLYSIVRQTRCRDIRDLDILLFKTKRFVRGFLSRILPARTKALIKRVIWRQGRS